MQRHVLAITVSSFMLLSGIMTASAQQTPTSPTMQQLNQQRAQTPHDYDEDDLGRGTMGDGRGMGMGHGRSEHGCMMHRGMMGQRGMMPLMRIIFALMDPDGDGTVSLEEFQAAHEKIFKAMDVDKDGTVSFEEMMNFMHGGGRAKRSPAAP
jgi:hypothetical protein